MAIKVHFGSQIFKLQLSLSPKGRILVYNRDQSIMHEFDADSVPHLVDYIKSDKMHNGLKTYVNGFIENGLLVVESRAPVQVW